MQHWAEMNYWNINFLKFVFIFFSVNVKHLMQKMSIKVEDWVFICERNLNDN